MKAPIALLACLLAALPAATLAGPQNHNNSGSAERSYSRSAPAARSSYRQSAPRQNYSARQSYAPRQTYTARQSYAPRQNYSARQTYTARQSYAPRQTYTARQNYASSQNYAPRYANRVAVNTYSSGGYNSGRWYGWTPRVGFWGGGFWGSLSIGLAPSAYIVQTDSPGYDLLAQYGLQQTDCDQPNLVDIQGPDGSQVCAFPNDQVGPGAYQVDPSTMTLVSE